MVRLGVTLAILIGLAGAARAEIETRGYLAYKAYEACMDAHASEYAGRQGPPAQLAGKIGRLCLGEEEAMQQAYTAEFLALRSDPGSAAEEARQIVEQVTSSVREAIRLEIERIRLERTGPSVSF
jgi:nucleoside phosphorylase